MIDINSKNVIISFLILIILSCAIVLLIVNNDDKPSEIKLVTTVSQSVDESDSTTSHSKKTTAQKERTSKKQKASIKNTTSKTTSIATSVKFPLDINKVTKDELMMIDGVGEVMANKILNHRKKLKYYSNLIQLKDIDGIGDATYKKLKKYLYVSKDKYKEITTTNEITSKTTQSKTSQTLKTTTTTAEKQMKMVNINTAEEQELMDSLLIDEEEAFKIIDFRENIGGKITNIMELYLVVGESEYHRIEDYIMV